MDYRNTRLIRRSLYSFLIFLLLLCQTAFAADFSKLMILHSNDTHGYDQSDDKHIGMPIFSQIKKEMQDKGYDVIMLDAGDFIQGNDLAKFDKGKSVVKYMNAVGYDAVTLGNHEFDYGQEVLAQRMKEAKFPFISCNVINQDTGETLVKPVQIIEKPYGKIGIIGLTTPASKTSARPTYVSNLKFLDGEALYACTQMYVNELQKAKCDLIIAIGHMGSEDGCAGSRSEDILAHVNGINIFIDAHDHKVKNDEINGALRVETGCHTQNLGCITYVNGKWQENLITLGQYTKPDKNVEKLVNNTAYAIDLKLGKSVGETTIALDGARMPGLRNQEAAIGDFCADALLWSANQKLEAGKKADACIVNGGAVRTGINAGNIKVKDLQAVFPFENELGAITIKGEKLLEIIEACTQNTPDEMGGFPQVSGIEFSLNLTVPYQKGPQYPDSLFYAPGAPGNRVTIKAVGGKPFDLNGEYKIIVNEFIIEGGDSFGGLTTEASIIGCEMLGFSDNEGLQQFITDRLHGKIPAEYASIKGRIKIIK
ncbi:MAG: bifunctional metallophosphatase/5'-nucleotidase [Anaerovibrio sp.]|uniref:bifunctional metallophosphatase/5'-nucleotidase n=1 Tax=Anaerovibrio sp. TaxID=1872532 RepID=UPI0025F00095|nr:bifunctional UDP-sugar hydrolase/5'-nucleotidase [Anaerovibrio sp.]MCR5177081.1 bifunctional metallophosphatase/5'-nucleotidase [Anaerovibrio sp.]